MAGKNEEWKFFLKKGVLAVALIVAANIFSLFVISEVNDGRENGNTNWVFLFSFVALAAVLVVVVNIVIVYILPKMRKSSEERKLSEENK